MSTVASDYTQSTLLNQSHPDWVSMEIEHLGKSLYNAEDLPLSDNIKNLKSKILNEAINKAQYDLLYEYSQSSEGLVKNCIRAKVWPLLLGIPIKDIQIANFPSDIEYEDDEAGDYLSTSDSSLKSTLPKKTLNLSRSTSHLLDELDFNDLPPHKDEDQIKLDIQRSFTILSHLQSFQQNSPIESYTAIYSKSDIECLRKKLSCLIIKMLRKYPSLNYYQGYHDVASIILLVCHENSKSESSSALQDSPINEDLAFSILEKLSIFHLRDFMITDINLSIDHLKLIPALLEEIDTGLFELIKQTSNSYIASDGLHYDYTFYQALSSILTMFSHDINNLHHLLIIWDFSLAQNSILTNIYIYVSFLLFRREDIFTKLNLPSKYSLDDIDACDYSDVDTDAVHSLISPSNLFDNLTDAQLIKILNRAKSLIKEFPVTDLGNSSETFDLWFKKFNRHSVLLNTSNMGTNRAFKCENYNHLLGEGTFNNLSKLASASDTANTQFPRSLNDLIQVQDDDMSKQTIHDIAVQQKVFEQQESLSASYNTLADDSSNSYQSLTSSLSSLSSASSSINTKIARQSSYFFKKFFSNTDVPTSSEDDEEPSAGKKLSKRNKKFTLFSNIYHLSFTVGFVGFLIHFLLIRNNPRLAQFNIFKVLNSSMYSLRDVGILTPMKSVGSELSHLGNDVASNVGETIGNVVEQMTNSEFVNRGIDVCQVGLGTLRDSLFGFAR